METQTVDTDVQVGVLSRMMGVFVSPGAAFSSLNVRVGWKDWLIPLILVGLVVGAAAYIMAPVTQDFTIEMTRARFENNPNMTEEQKEKALERVIAFQKGGGRYVGAGGALFGVAIVTFLSSAVFLALVNFVLGGDTTYKKALTVVSLGSLIAIPATLVTVPLAMSQGTPFVQLGLGLFLPESMSKSYLSAVLFNLNVFTIWQYAVVSIGLAAVADISTKKAAWGVFTLVILFSLAMGGLHSLTGSMG